VLELPDLFWEKFWENPDPKILYKIITQSLAGGWIEVDVKVPPAVITKAVEEIVRRGDDPYGLYLLLYSGQRGDLRERAWEKLEKLLDNVSDDFLVNILGTTLPEDYQERAWSELKKRNPSKAVWRAAFYCAWQKEHRLLALKELIEHPGCSPADLAAISPYIRRSDKDEVKKLIKEAKQKLKAKKPSLFQRILEIFGK
jgi:hypothetical protein